MLLTNIHRPIRWKTARNFGGRQDRDASIRAAAPHGRSKQLLRDDVQSPKGHEVAEHKKDALRRSGVHSPGWNGDLPAVDDGQPWRFRW